MSLFEKYSVVDLFCGIGGLTHGFVMENFNVKSGIDFDLSCKYAYEKNNNTKFIHADLTTCHSSEISSIFPSSRNRILIGCAPCQAFSPYAKNKKINDKWKLLYTFSRLIRDIEPEIISMENVPNLMNYAKGKVFKDFIKVLKEKKYSISYSVVNAQKYGVPQRRNRLILFASKYGEINILPPEYENRIVTVRDAIGHLPPIEDGVSHISDKLHRARKLSELNKKRIMATPEGGGWHNWDDDLVLECHKRESGKSFNSVYGRMRWDDVAPTLTTQCTGLGNGRFGHPQQDRAITLREAAILQSFPESYKFTDPSVPFSAVKIERFIGNAVPVKLGQIIALTIKKHIEENDRP